MSKTAQTKTNRIEFPTFEAGQATDQFRAFAEKGLEQSSEAFSRLKEGADTAQKAFEQSFENARAVSSELSVKSLSALRANSELTFSHFEALLGVKSIADFAELQSSYLRKQYELVVDQVKDLQTTSTKGAEDVVQPVKTVVERAWTELKVA